MARISDIVVTTFQRLPHGERKASAFAHPALFCISTFVATLTVIMLFPGVLISQDVRPVITRPAGRGHGSNAVEIADYGFRNGNIETVHGHGSAPFRAGAALTGASMLPALPIQPATDTASGRDPARCSLFMMPSGRTIPSVSGTIGLAAPYIPYAALSILPGLQISAGGVYITESEVGNDRSYYSYAIVKQSLFEDNNSSIAVGAAALFWGQEFRLGGETQWDRVTVPGVFAVTTFGSEESALSFGVGFADMAGGFGLGFDEGLLVGLGIGYETRLSPNWKLMTEHLSSVLSAGTLHTLGVRYFVGRAAFDLGVIIVPNGDVNLSGKSIPRVLPLLSVSVNLG